MSDQDTNQDAYLIALAAKQTPCFGSEDPTNPVCMGCFIRAACVSHKQASQQVDVPLPPTANTVSLPVRGICFVCGLQMPAQSMAVYVAERGTVHRQCVEATQKTVSVDPLDDDPVSE